MTEWVVAVPPSEVASGMMSRETESAAFAALEEHGCVLLRGVFSPALIDAMHREYIAQLGGLTAAQMQSLSERPPPNRLAWVGGARYDIILRMAGAFANPKVFANDLLIKLLRPLLGADMRLNSFTTVVSHPGAPRQQAHRDHDHLFPQPGIATSLPIYAVNVAVPLVDVDLKVGPTGVWLGSHRLGQKVSVQEGAMAISPLQRGDCMVLDYRTLHAGMPNQSTLPRPILYMVYSRRWFFDDINHINRIPLDMPIELYEGLPQAMQLLMVRGYSQALRARWLEAEIRSRLSPPNGEPPASLGKVGRNDPCPCGSGKKYKHCHGRVA